MNALKTVALLIAIAAIIFASHQFFKFTWQEILLVSAALAILHHDNRIRELSAEIEFLRNRVEALEDKSDGYDPADYPPLSMSSDRFEDTESPTHR